MIHSPSCFNSQYFAILGLSNLHTSLPKGPGAWLWYLTVLKTLHQDSLSKIQALEKRKPRTIIHLPEKAPYHTWQHTCKRTPLRAPAQTSLSGWQGLQTTAGGTEGQRTERLDWEHPQHRRFNASLLSMTSLRGKLSSGPVIPLGEGRTFKKRKF